MLACRRQKSIGNMDHAPHLSMSRLTSMTPSTICAYLRNSDLQSNSMDKLMYDSFIAVASDAWTASNMKEDGPTPAKHLAGFRLPIRATRLWTSMQQSGPLAGSAVKSSGHSFGSLGKFFEYLQDEGLLSIEYRDKCHDIWITEIHWEHRAFVHLARQVHGTSQCKTMRRAIPLHFEAQLSLAVLQNARDASKFDEGNFDLNSTAAHTSRSSHSDTSDEMGWEVPVSRCSSEEHSKEMQCSLATGAECCPDSWEDLA